MSRRIFFAGSTNTVQAGVQSTASTTTTTTTTVPDGANHTESDLDSMYLLLDAHLRPATPDMDDPKSVALFEEHKQLAQDFLKVITLSLSLKFAPLLRHLTTQPNKTIFS